MAKAPTSSELIAKYFEPKDRPIATAIMLAESGGRPLAKNINSNATTDYGLFQINSVHIARVGDINKLLDPETNVRVAAQIHAEQSWWPWVTYWNGSYKRHLSQ